MIKSSNALIVFFASALNIIACSSKVYAQLNLVPTYVSGASSDASCTSVDQTAGIQAAIDAASSQGGSVVAVPSGTFCAQGLIMKTGVTLRGSNEQFSIIKLTANSTKDLFVTDQVDTCMPNGDVPEPSAQLPNCGPVRYAWENITLDGNAGLNIQNNKGRGIYGYGRGMRLSWMFIQNTVRHCLFSGYAPGQSNDGDGYDYITRTFFARFNNCNTSGAADIPGQAGGGAVYQNGPTDSRYVETFVGWARGGYSWKFGQFGNGRFLGGEMYGGGGYPDGAHFTRWGLIGESRTGTNGTAIGLNFGGGVTAQVLMRTNGFERIGGKDYLIVQDSSPTSNTIGTGSKTFLLPGDTIGGSYGPISAGQPIHVYATSSPANYMLGSVTSYNSPTAKGQPGTIVIAVSQTSGSGSFAAWTLGPLVYQGGLQIGDYNSVNSLTSSGNTATASSPGHAFAVGSKITISGASPAVYNGTVIVTSISGGNFSYTLPSAPGIPASGTIIAGFPNISSITYDKVRMEDIDRFGVYFGSSGGFNRINMYGYTNNLGQSAGITGAPQPNDHYWISIDGNSPSKVWKEPDIPAFGPNGTQDWQSYIPTVSCYTNSPGPGVVAIGSYQRTGNTVRFTADVSIPNGGTNGCTYPQIGLPASPAGAALAVISGRELLTSQGIQALLSPGSSQANTSFSNGQGNVGNNQRFVLSGEYQAQ